MSAHGGIFDPELEDPRDAAREAILTSAARIIPVLYRYSALGWPLLSETDRQRATDALADIEAAAYTPARHEIVLDTEANKSYYPPMENNSSKNTVPAAAWFYSQPGFGHTTFSDEILCRGCNQAPAVVGSHCAACRKAMGLK